MMETRTEQYDGLRDAVIGIRRFENEGWAVRQIVNALPGLTAAVVYERPSSPPPEPPGAGFVFLVHRGEDPEIDVTDDLDLAQQLANRARGHYEEQPILRPGDPYVTEALAPDDVEA